MPKLTNQELKALVSAEKSDALGGWQASTLTDERTDALEYYMGDMSKDMPVPDGRSQAVSSDVADTIEGLMPSLMEIFAGSDEVVRFDPVAEDDVEAAEQETEYTNHCFYQKNDGFVTLYSFIKDALLSKLGVVKVWWEDKEQTERETYLGQTEDELAILLSAPGIEVEEHSFDEETGLHDVTVSFKRDYSNAKVMAVPPEEFGIARRARSLRDSHYCYHEVIRNEGDLIAEGYDSEQVKALQTYADLKGTERTARNTVGEDDDGGADSGINKAMRPLRVTEHYVRMDYEGKGDVRLYRVTTGGEDHAILRKEGEDQVVEIDQMPFAVMTPIIMTHRVFGRSIADVVMDIQRIKTALIRALLDNAYLANNPRTEVPESHAGPNTLDDLLVSRPGGIVRTKSPGGLTTIQTAPIGNHVFPLLQYWDSTREWRTGVSRQGQGLDADALQNQTATAAQQLYNAAQARMKLIARVFAETGIKDLFWLLHATIRKHAKQAAVVRLSNNWVTVDPRNWKTRNDLTVSVGLGSGGKAERISQLMMLIGLQKEAFAAGLTNMVKPKNLYNSAKELAKLLEHKDPEMFFEDPGEDMPEQQPDPKMIEMQQKAEIEKLQAQADIETQMKKVESEMALAQQKFEFDKELKLLEYGLKQDESKMKMLMSPRPRMSENGEMMEQEGPDPNAILINELLGELKRSNEMRQQIMDRVG